MILCSPAPAAQRLVVAVGDADQSVHREGGIEPSTVSHCVGRLFGVLAHSGTGSSAALEGGMMGPALVCGRRSATNRAVQHIDRGLVAAVAVFAREAPCRAAMVM